MTQSAVSGVLLLLFIGSGCAALVYEVVWFQLLELVIGASAVSLGVLLGTFMGGLGLGSYLLPRLLPSHWAPLRIYAGLELAVAALAIALLTVVPALNRFYAAWTGDGATGIVIRALAAALCLLPPTVLMGATLPAVARWVELSPKGVSWLGAFYAGNTIGAVGGSLLAGFYLLRVFDVATATYVAAGINVLVAAAALAIAAPMSRREAMEAHRALDVSVAGPAVSIGAAAPQGVRAVSAVYVAIALSGLTALACEVLWTRTLSLLLGATTYTFSLILAVFLAGLGSGSALGAWAARAAARPAILLAWCQLALVFAMTWTSLILTESLPYWPIVPSLPTAPATQLQLDLVRTVFAVFPSTLLWGVSFPLALAAVAGRTRDGGRLVGGVYAANTLGGIIGAVVTSLVLVVWIGTQRSQQLMMAIAMVSAVLLRWQERRRRGAFAAAVAAAATAALSVQPVPGELIAYGRYLPSRVGEAEVVYSGEGWNASVAVTERENGVLNYHNAGKVQASSEPQDMRLQRMLGHLTTLVPASAGRVLVIGCGAGVTAGAVSIDPTVEHETIAEIEPLVPKVVSTFFSDQNFGVVTNPKVHVRIDDARHFLQTTTGSFDAITSDPLDPWVKGAAMLYTREFFELARSRLNPGGVMTLFVQLYESNTEAVKSEIATFFAAFPEGMVFANTYDGAGYDLVLLGQKTPGPINVDTIQARLQTPAYQAVARSLAEIGMMSAVDLFATYAGSAKDYVQWLADADITRDRNLRLQYLAGRGLNLYRADAIFAEMLTHAKPPPANLFVGAQTTLDELAHKIGIVLRRSPDPGV